MRYQGKYTPSFPRKYKGDPSNVIYRSSWEYKFMKWCDITPSVSEWGSEEIIIPYTSPVDGKTHKYFPDFYIKTNNNDRYLIEVKPLKQTKEPKTQKRMSKRYINEVVTWSVNKAKWNAAEKFCSKQGWEFKIITEKELKV